MSGSKNFSMAWRNIWRNRRRTLLTLCSIAFGTFLAVLFTGMGDESYTKMINLAARMGSGHVAIQSPRQQDVPSLKNTITDAGRLAQLGLDDPDVDRATIRISGSMMLATARNSGGAYFIAVDPKLEDADTLAGYDSVIEGEFFSSASDKGIILGKTLAENLDVEIGKKLVYTVTNKQGEMVSKLVHVKGIVETGAPTLDRQLCILPLDSMRKALGYGPDEATLVALYTDDERVSADVAERIGEKLDANAVALTWKQTQPELAGFITMDSSGAVFFEIFILVLIAAGIFNSLFVSVMERMREFGIMMAIGCTPLRLFSLVMWESVWMGLAGLVAAVLLGIGPYLYLHDVGIDASSMLGGEGSEISGVAFDPVIHPDIYPEHLIYIGVVVFVATLLAGIYPAWRAGRVVPVETIRLV
jgi:ABC-type lipoprotein release transport system permease subunit